MDRGTGAGWHFAAQAAEVEDDVPSLVMVGERQIALCRLGDAFFAIDNVCTHEYACFTDGFIEDGEVECPLHQGCFAIRTGAPKGAPVTVPLKTYETRVDGDRLYIRR